MKIQSDKLVWDKYVYPRKNKSPKTINSYVEAMKIGAEFPPIEVQKVSNYIDIDTGEIIDAIIILDGVHRWFAYTKREIGEVDITEWQPDKVLDYKACKIELKLEAAERNTKHGDRISEGDKENNARQIADDDPEHNWTNETIAEKLGVSASRISGWISDIRTRQRASRESRIVRLARLGWTYEEVAQATDVSKSRVEQISKNGNFDEIGNLLSQGRDMDYIADYYSIDLALAWALRLDGQEDFFRFNGGVSTNDEKRELGWGLRTYDDWRFNDCDKRFGDDWPGRIPAQLVAHTLRFFTKRGDLVLDPMAGGGVVPDTCLAFERKCRAFDIVARDERPEIQYHYWETGNMAWPEVLTQGYGRKPDLIFFDPPYYTKKEKEYEEKAGDNGAVPISSLPRDEYLEFFAEFFGLAHKEENTKPATRLAFLNADWRDFQSTPALEEEPDSAITIFDYQRLLEQTNWQVTHIIDTPMSSQRFSGAIAKQMQLSGILGTTRRTLLIARKV